MAYKEQMGSDLHNATAVVRNDAGTCAAISTPDAHDVLVSKLIGRRRREKDPIKKERLCILIQMLKNKVPAKYIDSHLRLMGYL